MATKEATKEKKKPVPPKPTEFKYGITDIEAATGLKPASIRVALRESTFKKSDRVWGWNVKAEFDEVVKYLKARSEKLPKQAAAAKAAKAAAPKADAKGKTADKPKSGKKAA